MIFVGVAVGILFVYVIKPIIQSGPGEFSAGPNGFTIKTSGGSRITSVMIVPACRLDNYTDIWLRDGDKVTIKATGFVDTGAFINWEEIFCKTEKLKSIRNEPMQKRYCFPKPGNAPMTDRSPVPEPIDKIAAELLSIQLRNDYRFTWRDPDGNLEYAVDPKLLMVDPENDPVFETLKARKDSKYGCLLGYLSYGNASDFPKGKIDKDRVIEIGRNNELYFSGGIVRDDKGSKIEVSGNKIYLYLLVNDCILNKGDLENLLSKSQRLQHEYGLQLAFFDPQALSPKSPAEEWERKLRSLWYLNNAGSFTVVIEKNRNH
jgi:hypothetical protein